MIEIQPKPLVLNPPLNRTKITDREGLKKLRDFFTRCAASGKTDIGFDIETTPVKDFYRRKIRTIQFGNLTEQYVIDLLAFVSGESDTLHDCQGNYGVDLDVRLRPVVDCIVDVVCSGNFVKVGVNLGFEYMTFYWNLGLRTWKFYSCDMVERCIRAGDHSLKDYGFYSMEDMMLRYFNVEIDKELQQSFNLEDELSEDQLDYAALDTRLPIALKAKQHDVFRLPNGKLRNPWNIVTTGLTEIASIENDAIGAFHDMHIHGERLDVEKWKTRVEKSELELVRVIKEELDPLFIPIVGSKNVQVSDEQVDSAEQKWKSYRDVTSEELNLKSEARKIRKTNPVAADDLDKMRLKIEASRKETKDHYKHICSELKKHRTKLNKLIPECEGEALINYSSKAQVLEIFQGMKGLGEMKDTEDETLEKFSTHPVVAAFREYRGLSKEVGTYGMKWVTKWVTKPCKEEGYLHPADGRLHCVFNQFDAETGRSSSEKPNGQNLPQAEEVRSAFIADPPNENIRISKCCEVEAEENITSEGGHWCPKCEKNCETGPEEHVIVTADMSGAELRIIAELADDPVWIGAFNRDEDVHSVGTELLYPEQWPVAGVDGCKYYKIHTAETIKKPTQTVGDPMRQKCKCPEHNEMRNHNKAQNFLIAYGGTEYTLCIRIKKTVGEARALIAKHKAAFPKIWAYLDKSGVQAKITKEARDMFGRRRLFPDPTWDRAKLKAKADREEKLRLEKAIADQNIANFITQYGRKPKGQRKKVDSEMWNLTHRFPTDKEVASAYAAMFGSIERQGKNMCIQGTNASIAKKAMGCGFDPDGKPYLWHTFPQYKAKLVKFVHDELVVQCPKRFGKTVAALIGDAFKRAAAEKMKKVVMEFDFNIASFWKK